MRRVCVFCGSNAGARAAYAEAARALGDALVRRGLGLVYGGGSIGLMGVLADRVRAGGGEVIGVIPRALATKEIAHQGLADLRVVGSMALVEHAIAERFVHDGCRTLLLHATDPDRLLDALDAWTVPAALRKWLTLDET